MQRRQFLASGTALLSVPLAGCAHPPVVLDMDVATANDIANQVSMTPETDSEEYTLATSAIQNGSATRRGRNELFYSTNTVRVNNTFYNISETQIRSREVETYDVRIDFNPDNTTPKLGTIQYDNLPEADKQRLEPVFSRESPPSHDGYDIGVNYGVVDHIKGDSVLVPEQQYDIILRDENLYRASVTSQTVSEGEYRYEATEVAPDVETFADQIRERYLFELTGLSEEEQEVVDEAINGGYFKDDSAFQSVIDKIRKHDGFEKYDHDGTWLIEYESTEYNTYAEW